MNHIVKPKDFIESYFGHNVGSLIVLITESVSINKLYNIVERVYSLNEDLLPSDGKLQEFRAIMCDSLLALTVVGIQLEAFYTNTQQEHNDFLYSGEKQWQIYF